MLSGVWTVLLLPSVKAVRGRTETVCHFDDTVTPISNLANGFDFELFRVSLVAHKHLSDCHFVWLKGV
jgi:hypothetical protein